MFLADRDLCSMDIFVQAGALQTWASSWTESLLKPQAAAHLRVGSVAVVYEATAKPNEARKRVHYARPSPMFLDKRSFKPTTI